MTIVHRSAWIVRFTVSVAVAVAALLWAQPAAAEGDTYTCSNGNLIKNGQNIGAYTRENPYDLGGGWTTWCDGSRVGSSIPMTEEPPVS